MNQAGKVNRTQVKRAVTMRTASIACPGKNTLTPPPLWKDQAGRESQRPKDITRHTPQLKTASKASQEMMPIITHPPLKSTTAGQTVNHIQLLVIHLQLKMTTGSQKGHHILLAGTPLQ